MFHNNVVLLVINDLFKWHAMATKTNAPLVGPAGLPDLPYSDISFPSRLASFCPGVKCLS